MNKKYPEIGDIIVSKIDKILDYGCQVSLPEFDELKGFVHVSEVSSSWVKNIRNFVKEGQIKAGKVLGIKGDTLEISFSKVNANTQRQVLEEWNQNKRIVKLLEIMARDTKLKIEKLEELLETFFSEYDSKYSAIKALLENPKLYEKIPEQIRQPLRELIEKNFSLPKKTIKRTISLMHQTGRGIETLKKAFSSLDKSLNIIYLGSNKFQLSLESSNYKKAEKKLDEAIEILKKEIPKDAKFELLAEG
jgi:translation initiation factor 2 subunit 1